MLRSKTPIALFVFLVVFATIVGSPVWGQADAAAISSARNTILNCYSAVKEAETAGANITLLVSTLNEAGSLLSQAELAYATGDFNVAFNLASQSQNTLANLIGEANTLRDIATRQQNQDFLITVVGSIIGTFVVMFASFVVWRFLKKKYEPIEASVSESPRV